MFEHLAVLARLLWEYNLYLVVIGIATPFLLSGLCFHVYPTRRALFWLLLPTLGFGFNFLFGGIVVTTAIALTVDACVVAALIVDFVLANRMGKDVSARRVAESIASLGSPLDVQIIVENRSEKPIEFEIVDDFSPWSVAISSKDQIDLTTATENKVYATEDARAFFDRRTLAAGSQETLEYRIVWNRRGEFQFDFISARFTSPLKCWRKMRRFESKSTFRVYPNVCQLTQMELISRKSQLFLLGVRRTRRVGQDEEFERLRDYSHGDQFKFIDWKATARRNKLTIRDFQSTRNQRVIIALDAGRMMMNASNGITLFDHALNTALALAYVALKQGDEVGFMIFSNNVKKFVSPRGGGAQINALIRSVFDVFPDRVESRYDRAFSYLKRNVTKRSLVALITNTLDERTSSQIEQTATNLLGAHLPLTVFLREHSLFDAIERFNEFERNERARSDRNERLARFSQQYREVEPVEEIERILWDQNEDASTKPDDLFFRAGAAAEILLWRRKTILTLESKGALTLDVFPENATAPLINKYLEIKARRLL